MAILRPGAGQAAEAPLRYNRDVRPILSDNCFHCHGPDKKTRDGGLRLDVREEAIRAAKSGDVAIVPGDVAASQLLVRILSDDREEIMPPPKAHKQLTPEQKSVLTRWVAQGAPYEAHWAYAPLQRPVVPAGGASPVDALVAQRLAERGLQPAPEADRRTLLRRVSLDLTGLPPSPAEVRAFLADARPDAYERLVDRLLASPQYGERMAQGWLDMARYADTVGFHGDQNQNVWAYRDWVINAFNRNLPFDQFTTEQLAGDLLPNPTPEQLTATCFNRLNMMTREGGAQAKEYLAKYTMDRVRTVGTTWLGATVGCAECHDHKFDPWTQKDVYSLGAFFADVKQWGVYSDYGYTPNPELKGFTNEYPFPPEQVVPSAALQRRLAAARAHQAEVAAQATLPAEALHQWRTEMAAFLAKNPQGWEVPTPTVSVRPTKPEGTPGKEGRVAIAVDPKGGRIVQLDFTPVQRVATLRLELLPAAGSLLRSGTAETLAPIWALVRKDGTAKPLAVRYAGATAQAPRYSNGAEVLGVQGAWKLDATRLAEPATAYYFLEQPVQLGAGESLRLTLAESQVSTLRVASTPLAPDVQTLRQPKQLAARLAAEPGLAQELYLRATGGAHPAWAELKRLDGEVLALRGGTTPVLITQRAAQPLPIRILPRGNWQDESGEICQPATPHFLPPLPDAAGRTLTRLDLAKWLVSPENPLPARVTMNRLWRQFFGTALSAQTDDLGAQGEAPSHPELLDWLAAEFRQSGWDTKHMVRTLVLSHTYRQVSGLRREVKEQDPQNRLLSAQNPRRLDAENVRDNALAIAGLLSDEIGGPAAKPYQPAEYFADLQFPSRTYTASAPPEQWRRGVYMWWQRTLLHPMLLNFDAPSREDCLAQRTQANTPQQALTLLNDPTFVEAARTWASHLLELPGDDSARLTAAYQQALARDPRPEERASLLRLLERARTEEATPKVTPVSLPAGPVAGDFTAWTTVCRVLLNLHETITRY